MRAPDAAQRSWGALLIRGGAHYFLRVALGPGSVVHREERCIASGTRSFTPSQDDAVCPLAQPRNGRGRLNAGFVDIGGGFGHRLDHLDASAMADVGEAC